MSITDVGGCGGAQNVRQVSWVVTQSWFCRNEHAVLRTGRWLRAVSSSRELSVLRGDKGLIHALEAVYTERGGALGEETKACRKGACDSRLGEWTSL